MYGEYDKSSDSMSKEYLGPKKFEENDWSRPPYLYRASICVNQTNFINPKRCFPVGSRYAAKFFNLPIFILNSEQGKSITFPMDVRGALDTDPVVQLHVLYGDQIIAEGKTDLREQFDEIIVGVQNCEDFPLVNCRQEKLILFADELIIAEANVTVELSCLGDMEVKEINEENIPAVWTSADTRQIEVEYDEFEAEINGHSLNVKVLKKKKEKKDRAGICDCDYPNAFSSKNSGKANGAILNGNQVKFDFPSDLNVCNKGQQNAIAYNVGTCMEGSKHGHSQDKVKILEGYVPEVEPDGCGTFSIRLGGKGEGENGKERFQVQLKAPRPFTAEDFKKPSRDVGVQTTESAKKAVKGKGKSKK